MITFFDFFFLLQQIGLDARVILGLFALGLVVCQGIVLSKEEEEEEDYRELLSTE